MNPQSPSHISKSKLWHVHGKSYDLVPMLRSHPGGEDILIMSQGLPDCTCVGARLAASAQV
jgi:cytochrome b involved in lipid metabolism